MVGWPEGGLKGLQKDAKKIGSGSFLIHQGPKEGVFTIIFGAKIHNNWFSNSFQYFIVNYHNGIFLHVHIFISLAISCIFYGQKTRKLVIMLLLESLLKKSIITNFLIF